ncbi:TonB-dependent receptor [Methylomonas sp. AM2-LC]|uniref:TonB-dependent siderophore receptor n=1 Tax=Methylomonas sp. AM2-LC TaxID=3153301 RepID=UPI003265270F
MSMTSRTSRSILQPSRLHQAIQHILLASALIVSAAAHGETSTDTASIRHNYHISGGSLGQALRQFATNSGLLYSAEVELTEGKTTVGLDGDYTVEEGFKKLLAGSGLTYSITSDNSVAIKVADAESNTTTTLPKVNVVGNTIYDVKDPYNEDYVLPNATAGTKTETPIMETPLNVQVISKQVLKDQQVITLGDALKNVSGVVVSHPTISSQMPQGGTQTDITLRGFASSTFLRNGFRLQQGNRAMANVESVEVLKGPAAVLYGLVEPGGMVNVITKQPQATPYYALSQQFGSYDMYRTTMDATGPVADNKDVLYRMNMSYQNSGSYQDFVGTEDIFLAPVLKWNISPKTQATVEFEYNRNHQGVGSSFNPYIGGQLLNIPISRNYGEYSPVVTETFFGSINWSHQFNDDWAIKHSFSANQNSNTANNHVPSFAVSSDLMNVFAPDYAPFNGPKVIQSTYPSVSQNNTYATNLDLTGHFDTLGLKHTLLLGGDYYRLDTANRSEFSQKYTFIDPYNPVHPGLPFTVDNSVSLSGQQFQTDQYGLYFQDQIKLPFNVHVTGGLRYQYLHQNSIQSSQDIVSPANGATHDAVTPRVGILWHPQGWVSLYANYVESFGANSGLVYGGSPGQGNIIAPTNALQYEGGVKTEFFDGRLRATLAYYDLTKTNVATGDPNRTHDCGNGGPGLCSLAIGAVRSRGPELDIQGEILPGWNAIATWANVDIIVEKTNASNDPLNGGINVGDRMWNVPRNTASFWSTYELQNTDLKGLKFGGGVTVRDGQVSSGGQNFFTNVYSPAIKSSGYATLGLMTAYTHAIGKSKVTFQLNIDNLLDKRYYTNIASGYSGGVGIDSAYATYGAPRTAMGSISIQY